MEDWLDHQVKVSPRELVGVGGRANILCSDIERSVNRL